MCLQRCNCVIFNNFWLQLCIFSTVFLKVGQKLLCCYMFLKSVASCGFWGFGGEGGGYLGTYFSRNRSKAMSSVCQIFYLWLRILRVQERLRLCHVASDRGSWCWGLTSIFVQVKFLLQQELKYLDFVYKLLGGSVCVCAHIYIYIYKMSYA